MDKIKNKTVRGCNFCISFIMEIYNAFLNISDKSPHNNYMITRYIIYGFLGWNMEIIWTGLGTLSSGSKDLMGHTSVWMFFIYGTAVFLEPIHKAIGNLNWFLRGCIWTCVIFIIEFVCGMILASVGIYAWQYNCAASIMGVIRLDYAPLWFAVGLIFERVHDALLAHHV